MTETTQAPAPVPNRTFKEDWQTLPVVMRWFGYLSLGYIALVILDQSFWWMNREDYYFGFLVPFFVGYVLMERWPQIRGYFAVSPDETEPLPSRFWDSPAVRGFFNFAFAAGMIFSVLFFLLGALMRGVSGGATQPGSLALAAGLAGFLIGGVYWVSPRRSDGAIKPMRERLTLVLLFTFPALIWLLSAPLLNIIETKLSLFLLDKVTVVVVFTFDTLGLPLRREGNILHLPEGSVGVAEACSGIRSLTACLFAGSFLAAVFLNQLWKKVTLILTALFLAFATNILRSLFLTGWAYAYGSDAIEGAVHDVTGYAVLVLTSIFLLILVPIFNFRTEWDEEPEEDESTEDKPNPS
jgi:exosortase/archaeosortase family protein